jgi:hypothetical protein
VDCRPAGRGCRVEGWDGVWGVGGGWTRGVVEEKDEEDEEEDGRPRVRQGRWAR